MIEKALTGNRSYFGWLALLALVAANGVYFYRLGSSGNSQATGKLVKME